MRFQIAAISQGRECVYEYGFLKILFKALLRLFLPQVLLWFSNIRALLIQLDAAVCGSDLVVPRKTAKKQPPLVA